MPFGLVVAVAAAPAIPVGIPDPGDWSGDRRDGHHPFQQHHVTPDLFTITVGSRIVVATTRSDATETDRAGHISSSHPGRRQWESPDWKC